MILFTTPSSGSI